MRLPVDDGAHKPGREVVLQEITSSGRRESKDEAETVKATQLVLAHSLELAPLSGIYIQEIA
ncbi:MAG TPA: hypothetical protein VH593_10265 [Ktedonobacteraceae bacterium]|jgi:hypothetical protein